MQTDHSHRRFPEHRRSTKDVSILQRNFDEWIKRKYQKYLSQLLQRELDQRRPHLSNPRKQKNCQSSSVSLINEQHGNSRSIWIIFSNESLTSGDPTLANPRKWKTSPSSSAASINELNGNINWYCFSPKKFKKPTNEAYSKANELKVVISHLSDFQWAEEHAAKTNKSCKLYLQPEWDKAAQITPLVIEYIKANPKWELSAQLHKYIQVP